MLKLFVNWVFQLLVHSAVFDATVFDAIILVDTVSDVTVSVDTVSVVTISVVTLVTWLSGEVASQARFKWVLEVSSSNSGFLDNVLVFFVPALFSIVSALLDLGLIVALIDSELLIVRLLRSLKLGVRV